MKYFLKTFAILTPLFYLLGCAPPRYLETNNQTFPTERNFNANFDKVWVNTLKSVSYFPLTIIEKNSGIINTDWITYVETKKISVWRGLIGGGQVEDDMPAEISHRINILVTEKDSVTINVKIIRYVKVRNYLMVVGGKGNWAPDSYGIFTQVNSDTRQENKILNAIEENILKKN